MTKILVLIEHDGQSVKPTSLSVLTASAELKGSITALIIGTACESVAESVRAISGVQQVICVLGEQYRHFLAEALTPVIVRIAKEYTHVLAPATTFGKNSLPRVAALLDVSLLSDVVQIKDEQTFVRPIYAGNAMITVKTDDPIKLLTIRTTAFARAVQSATTAPIEYFREEPLVSSRVRWVKTQATVSSRPELTAARVVVSGGRGMQKAEHFALLEALADKLNAAMGASRAAVDAGFVPNEYQVGQTGKVVAPELYIAVGISGAIQHLAGMKDSKVIVAINKDPEAPIFQVADYGLVGDLFEILPELTRLL